MLNSINNNIIARIKESSIRVAAHDILRHDLQRQRAIIAEAKRQKTAILEIQNTLIEQARRRRVLIAEYRRAKVEEIQKQKSLKDDARKLAIARVRSYRAMLEKSRQAKIDEIQRYKSTLAHEFAHLSFSASLCHISTDILEKYVEKSVEKFLFKFKHRKGFRKLKIIFKHLSRIRINVKSIFLPIKFIPDTLHPNRISA